MHETTTANADTSGAGAAPWVRVGQSTATDSVTAAREATEAAVGGDVAKLVVIFTSAAHELEAVATTVSEVSAPAQVIGCSTAGELVLDGPADSSVVVMALGGDGFDVATGVGICEAAQQPDADPTTLSLREAAATAASCVKEVGDREHKVLLLLADGLVGDQMEVVRGAYEHSGANIPLVGGCAGDDLAMNATYQIFGEQVHRGAVVAAAISSDRPIGIGVRHGWEVAGDSMLVTSSHGVVVETLDDQPALDVYLDRFDAPESVRTDVDAFIEFAVTRPFGIRRRDRMEIRYVGGADFEKRTVHCIAEVPQGGLAWTMTGDADTILSATDDACIEAVEALDGAQPLGLMTFDCIARRSVLEVPGTAEEVARMRAHASGAPIAGFYTYGEIARSRGAGGFHNQTLVVLALA
ncbi:MAG: FIST signal transduction protein [Actinomycetes bacterium]